MKKITFRWIAVFSAIGALTGIGCVSLESGDHIGAGYKYLPKEEWATAKIDCTNEEVGIRDVYFELIPNVRQRMVEDGINVLVDEIDLRAIGAIGLPRNSDSTLVSVLLVDTVNANVRIVGEGGIEIVIDPCTRTVVSTNRFRI